MLLTLVLEELTQSRALSADTINNYRRAIQYFSNHIGRDAEIRDLSVRAVNSWLTRSESIYPPSYCVSLRRDLLVSWNFAADMEYCEHPKTRLVRIPKCDRKLPEAWPLEWIPKLLESARTIPGKLRRRDCLNCWYAEAYFRCQFELLCRPKDLRNLQWSMIQTDGNVEFKQSKTGNTHRAILKTETLRAVNRLQGMDDKQVFPLSKSATEMLIRRVFAHAEIGKPCRQSLGHTRHTGGTAIAARSNNDVARRALGHTPDSKVFEQFYLDQEKIAPVQVDWFEEK